MSARAPLLRTRGHLALRAHALALTATRTPPTLTLCRAFPPAALSLGLRPEDVRGLFDFPYKISKLQTLADRVESGELKLRVRALEVERALFRAALLQSATLWGLAGCVLLNLGVFTLLIAGRGLVGVVEIFGGGFVFCAVRAAYCLLKLRQVLRDERNKYYNSYLA